MRLYYVALALVFAGLLPAQDFETCGKPCTGGLAPDELSKKFGSDSAAAFRDAVCGDWFKSHQERVEGEGGVNVIEIVSLGGSGASERKSVDRGTYCRDTSLVASNKTMAEF